MNLLLLLYLISLTTSIPYNIYWAGLQTACSAYCDYHLGGITPMIYIPDCSGVNPNQCTSCDQKYFKYTGTTMNTLEDGIVSNCVPHWNSNQHLAVKFTQNSYRVLTPSSAPFPAGRSTMYFELGSDWGYSIFTTTIPHYAVRARFAISLYNNDIYYSSYTFYYGVENARVQYTMNTTQYFSYSDIVTTNKYEHYTSTATVTFQLDNDPCCSGCSTQIYGSCVSCCWSNYCCPSYIMVWDVMLFVSPCSNGCMNCTSLTFCTVCGIDKYGLNTYLSPVDNLCYAYCPQTYYAFNNTFLNGSYLASTPVIEPVCLQCFHLCLQCNVTNVNCTQCFTAGRNQSFWFNYTCYVTCPYNYQHQYFNHTCICPQDYFYNSTNGTIWCYKCSQQCVRCFGVTNLQCTICEIGYYLEYYNTYCLSSCPGGQYQYNLNKSCLLCDSVCATCTENSTYCTSCYFSNIIQLNKYLLNHLCLSICPAGYQMNNVSLTCDVCPGFSYSYNGFCLSQCPYLFVKNEHNHSCISIADTDLQYNISLEDIHITADGKLIKFKVRFSEDLNQKSMQWLLQNGYNNIQIIQLNMSSTSTSFITNKRLLSDRLLSASASGSNRLLSASGSNRLLSTSNSSAFHITNIELVAGSQSSAIYIYTTIPSDLNFNNGFSIQFTSIGKQLSSIQGVTFQDTTNTLSVINLPTLMREYYLYCWTTNNLRYYNLYPIPVILGLVLLIFVQINGTYQMLMELIRCIQIIGLLLYSLTPAGSDTYYFIMGCNYANFDFMPNLYLFFGAGSYPTQGNQISAFGFTAYDMDFLKGIAAILIFAIFWLIICFMCWVCFGKKDKKLLFFRTFGADIIEVKIMHSFWSSLFYVLINSDKMYFQLFVSHSVGFIFLLAVVGRRYLLYKEKHLICPFFIWRLICTLLVLLISLSNLILVCVIVMFSLVISMQYFNYLSLSKHLININDMNSTNYKQEQTFIVLNQYDLAVPHCYAVVVRNIFNVILPVLTAILLAIVILIRSQQFVAIWTTYGILLVLTVVCLVLLLFIYCFLQERRKHLVELRLRDLQEKYIKINILQTQAFFDTKGKEENARSSIKEENARSSIQNVKGHQYNQDASMLKMVEE